MGPKLSTDFDRIVYTECLPRLGVTWSSGRRRSSSDQFNLSRFKRPPIRLGPEAVRGPRPQNFAARFEGKGTNSQEPAWHTASANMTWANSVSPALGVDTSCSSSKRRHGADTFDFNPRPEMTSGDVEMCEGKAEQRFCGSRNLT